jgi:hypothetical protein
MKEKNTNHQSNSNCDNLNNSMDMSLNNIPDSGPVINPNMYSILENKNRSEFESLPVEQQSESVQHQIETIVHDLTIEFIKTNKKMTLPLPENWKKVINYWCKLPSEVAETIYFECAHTPNSNNSICITKMVTKEVLLEIDLYRLEGGRFRNFPEGMYSSFERFVYDFQYNYYDQKMFARLLKCLQLANVNVFEDSDYLKVMDRCKKDLQFKLNFCKQGGYIKHIEKLNEFVTEFEKKKEEYKKSQEYKKTLTLFTAPIERKDNEFGANEKPSPDVFPK